MDSEGMETETVDFFSRILFRALLYIARILSPARNSWPRHFDEVGALGWWVLIVRP
jgi:hypothetical protein